jgi:glycosyltransferase involved in cell wall biosynthesis
MRVALVAPPFISVPPKVYGGTELFIATLAEGLKKLNFDVVVYTNGESTVGVEKRWLYPAGQWPIEGEVYDNLKDINHTAWAIRDAVESCDVVHLNNLPGLVHSRFTDVPFAYTVHHPQQPGLTEFYTHYPDVHYVTISRFQLQRERMARMCAIHHGVDVQAYRVPERKQPYLSFIGRIAPIKGTHIAIAVAQQAGIPLKIAGEVQPMFRDYFEREIKPHVDGKFIEYIGEANLEEKNELLGNSLAMLFPIQWDEPFGLVMIEAMACGTPVLALPGGAVQEIVCEGVSGSVCNSVEELIASARGVESRFNPLTVRKYIEQNFSLERMVSDYARLYCQIRGTETPKTAEDITEHRAVA